MDHTQPPQLPHVTRSSILYLIAAVALLALFVYLFDVLLLFFGAVLIAVLIRWPTNALRDRARVPDAVALSLVILMIVTLMALGTWLLGDSLAQQINALADQVPELWSQMKERFGQYSALRPLLEQRPMEAANFDALGRGLEVIAATFGALTNLVLILFVAVLLAAQPKLYVEGSLHLFPLERRKRVHDVLKEAGATLQRWIVGQLALMLMVGILTYVGLTMLDMPMAGALALLAGLLTFIPFVGPLLAGAVAVLVGLAESVELALYVALLYVGVQAIESACEPIVQQKAVYLPPAVLLLSQVVLGVLAGPLGVVLATPVAAAAIVMIKRFYVEDVLEDTTMPDSTT